MDHKATIVSLELHMVVGWSLMLNKDAGSFQTDAEISEDGEIAKKLIEWNNAADGDVQGVAALFSSRKLLVDACRLMKIQTPQIPRWWRLQTYASFKLSRYSSVEECRRVSTAEWRNAGLIEPRRFVCCFNLGNWDMEFNEWTYVFSFLHAS